jgi:hypothetical protein
MLYPIFRMSYYVYTNDHPRTLVPGGNISLTNDVTKELFLSVSFEIIENDVVCMTTVLPLTYISGGEQLSESAGDKITFPLDHVVFLCTNSVTYPRIKMRVAKQRRPRPPSPPSKRTRIVKTLSTTPLSSPRCSVSLMTRLRRRDRSPRSVLYFTWLSSL